MMEQQLSLFQQDDLEVSRYDDKVIVEVEVISDNQEDTRQTEEEQYLPLCVFQPQHPIFTAKLSELEKRVTINGEKKTWIMMGQREVMFKYCISCTRAYADGDKSCCNNMILWVPEPTPDTIDHVIFHGGCQDGHGSLWAAHRKLCKSKGHAKAMEMIRNYGARHENFSDNKQSPERENLIAMCKKRNVLIADFAFEAPVILDIKKVCSTFILLDHHNSNMNMLKGEPNCYFDESHSGAYLTMAFMLTGVPLEEADPHHIPKLIKYIQDRDLWRFTEPKSREIGAAIYTDAANRLENFDTIDSNEEESFRLMEQRGENYLKHQEAVIERGTASVACVRTLLGMEVVVCNTNVSPSESGELLLRNHKYQHCRIAVIWNWTGGKYKFHLRRRDTDNELDLGAISKIFWGGGGHPAAAGFSLADNIAIGLFFQTYAKPPGPIKFAQLLAPMNI